jgi:hypothetical protein
MGRKWGTIRAPAVGLPVEAVQDRPRLRHALEPGLKPLPPGGSLFQGGPVGMRIRREAALGGERPGQPGARGHPGLAAGARGSVLGRAGPQRRLVLSEVAVGDAVADAAVVVPVGLVADPLRPRASPQVGDGLLLRHAQRVGPGGRPDRAVMRLHPMPHRKISVGHVKFPWASQSRRSSASRRPSMAWSSGPGLRK